MSESLFYPNSYYAASANAAPERAPLEGDHQADVCVIGGGYTGLSTAISLLEKGFSVILLEQAKIGYGASGRNGGQIVNSYSRDMDFVEKWYGKTLADQMGSMAFEGGDIIRERIEKYNIECDYKKYNIFAAITPKQMHELEEKTKLWGKYGHTEIDLLDKTELKTHIGSDRYIGGMLDKKGGQIHPLNLALGEASAVESLGGKIFEHSQAIRVEEGEEVKIFTEKGVVGAKFIVVAGNAYLGDLLPKLSEKTVPCGTQVLTTEPLGEALAKELLPTDICVEDSNYLLDYYRLTADNRLIYGGDVAYGAREPARIESIIRPKMLKTFPQLANVKIDYTWTGNFSLTLSRMPQVGKLGKNILYSQGCSGHGVTFTHLAGRFIGEAIMGNSSRFDAFASLPHFPFPGGIFRVPLLSIGAWYYDMRDRFGL